MSFCPETLKFRGYKAYKGKIEKVGNLEIVPKRGKKGSWF